MSLLSSPTIQSMTSTVSLLPSTNSTLLNPSGSTGVNLISPSQSPVSLLPSSLLTSSPSLISSVRSPPRAVTPMTGATIPSSTILPVGFPMVKYYPDIERSSSPSRIYTPEEHGGVLIGGNPLSESQAKFCSCVLKVESKGYAYNPYAVCAKTIGTTMGRSPCTPYYDFENMPVELLESYITLHKIPLPMDKSRESLIDTINQWKSIEGKTAIRSPRRRGETTMLPPSTTTKGVVRLPLTPMTLTSVPVSPIIPVASPPRLSYTQGSTSPLSLTGSPPMRTVSLVGAGSLSPISSPVIMSKILPLSPVVSPVSSSGTMSKVLPVGSPLMGSTVPLLPTGPAPVNLLGTTVSGRLI